MRRGLDTIAMNNANEAPRQREFWLRFWVGAGVFLVGGIVCFVWALRYDERDSASGNLSISAATGPGIYTLTEGSIICEDSRLLGLARAVIATRGRLAAKEVLKRGGCDDGDEEVVHLDALHATQWSGEINGTLVTGVLDAARVHLADSADGGPTLYAAMEDLSPTAGAGDPPTETRDLVFSDGAR